MMHCTKSIALVISLCAGLACAEEAYDLPRLEALALQENRLLRAERDQAAAAGYGVRAAAAYPNPELEYLSGNQRPRGMDGLSGTASSWTLSQPIDLPARRQARIAVAEAGHQASLAMVRSAEADLLAGVRQRYFDLLRRQAELRNAQEDKALMESVRGRIALRVETGEAPRFELIKAEAESLNAAKIAQAAAFRVDQARSQLRQAVGGGLADAFAVSGTLRDVPALPPLGLLKTEVAERNPELSRARADLVRAEQALSLERAQRWPDLAFKAATDRDPEMQTTKFGVVVRIPLWDRRDGQVREAAARLSGARSTLEARAYHLEQALAVAYQQYEIAETQVTALESGIVRQAEAALKVAEAAYRFGERGFLEVLDAQRVYRAARAELIGARHELAAAWVEVERLRAASRGN